MCNIVYGGGDVAHVPLFFFARFEVAFVSVFFCSGSFTPKLGDRPKEMCGSQAIFCVHSLFCWSRHSLFETGAAEENVTCTHRKVISTGQGAQTRLFSEQTSLAHVSLLATFFFHVGGKKRLCDSFPFRARGVLPSVHHPHTIRRSLCANARLAVSWTILLCFCFAFSCESSLFFLRTPMC